MAKIIFHRKMKYRLEVQKQNLCCQLAFLRQNYRGLLELKQLMSSKIKHKPGHGMRSPSQTETMKDLIIRCDDRGKHPRFDCFFSKSFSFFLVIRPVNGKPFVPSFYFCLCIIVYSEQDGEVLYMIDLLLLDLNLFGQVTHL